MARKLLLSLGPILLLGLPLLGSPPVVLQPNTGSYGAVEVAGITTEINALNGILSDVTFACNRKLGEYRWATSLDFAAYTVGLLASRGYMTRLVAQAGWADGQHAWVLVGIPLGGRVAWIPVEATPAAGEVQRVLGRLPLRTDGDGQLWFDDAYLHPADEISLPANLSPVARVNFAPSKGKTGVAMTFLGDGARDSDGEILHYLWAFGDGTTGKGHKVNHTYAALGIYTLSLTVIDNRGASHTVTLPFTVEGEAEKTDCGCGG
jgi:hypothetical protein